MKANRKFKEENEAVSAVIGVILMVAITVAIAATVYLYISGFFGGGLSNTPTVGMSAEPSGTSCAITLGSPTANDIDWEDVEYVLTNVSDSTGITLAQEPWSYADGTMVKAGQLISIPTNTLVDGKEYRFTISYEPTGGQLGTCSWTQ